MSGTNSGYDHRTGGHNDGGAFGNTRDSGYGSGNSGNSSNNGPHKSSLLNKLDPRVDSNPSGSNHNPTHSGYGNTTGPSGTTGGYGNTSNYDNPRSANEGPHNSSLENKVDPRVDSDRDGRAAGTGHGSNNYGGNSTNYDNPRSANEGPHNNSLGNKVDPRVDSDRDGRAAGTGYGGNTYGNNTGYGSGNAGGYNNNNNKHHHGNTTGTSNYDNPRSTNEGPYNSNTGNKLDPRVDSDRDNRGYNNTYGDANTGFNNSNNASEGPAGISSNAEGHGNGGSTTGIGGPHKSHLANLLDPRVDSNNPGSGTSNGGQATANASVAGAGSGPSGAPEGQASASGPRSATANTTTSNNPVKGAFQKLAGETSHGTGVGQDEVGNGGYRQDLGTLDGGEAQGNTVGRKQY